MCHLKYIIETIQSTKKILTGVHVRHLGMTIITVTVISFTPVNNEHNSYPKMSVKWLLACRNTTSGHLCHSDYTILLYTTYFKWHMFHTCESIVFLQSTVPKCFWLVWKGKINKTNKKKKNKCLIYRILFQIKSKTMYIALYLFLRRLWCLQYKVPK